MFHNCISVIAVLPFFKLILCLLLSVEVYGICLGETSEKNERCSFLLFLSRSAQKKPHCCINHMKHV